MSLYSPEFVPVRVSADSVSLYTPEELSSALRGVDVAASELMALDMDEWADAHPCDCEALCVCVCECRLCVALAEATP